MNIPQDILEAFKQIWGTSTLADDPMDFNRIPKAQTRQLKKEPRR